MEQIMWLNAFLMTNYQDRMALPMNSLINVGHTLNKNSTTFVVAFSKKKHLIPEYQYFLHHFNPKSGWCGVGVIFQAYFFVEPLHQINHQALANRLHLIIMKLIHHNQYGVIRTRTIQDCLAWSFEYLHLCHHPRKEISISKLHSRKLLIKLSIKQQNKDIGS